jgi:hypothetical protein
MIHYVVNVNTVKRFFVVNVNRVDYKLFSLCVINKKNLTIYVHHGGCAEA